MFKKIKFTTLILWILGWVIAYFIMLPPINVSSIAFWGFFTPALLGPMFIFFQWNSLKGGWKNGKAMLPLAIVILILAVILIGQVAVSPIFNSNGWKSRIYVHNSVFEDDVKEVDFDNLPLLDKASSQKVGDRVVGQITDLVSQFAVSDEYSLINYKGSIVRVTPLEYNGFYKFMANHEGTSGYVIVDTTTGEAQLVKTQGGLKYLPSSYFFKNLTFHLRMNYPFEIFGDSSFEIDEQGEPYWIVQTLKYSWISVKKEVSGVVAVNAITGKCSKYKVNEVPEWIDNVYDAALVIDEINSWGKYQNGYFNSKFSQKNVVQTTEGYTYVTKNNDVFLYTGITSVSSDESNIGFVLVNLRTHDASYYEVAGAEEFSAMDSATGLVPEKNYTSTFPLLINLNGRPTYLLSLKDAAGLVKMYGFVDVVNYQKVSVTDASLGIKKAAENYLKLFNSEPEKEEEKEFMTAEITVSRIASVIVDGNTYYMLMDDSQNIYALKASIDLAVTPFIEEGKRYEIKYYFDKANNIDQITEIRELPQEIPVENPENNPEISPYQ